MSDNLIHQDAYLRREANTLLADRGPLLAEYGTVHLSGSYALQLMTWRDLDIYMEAPNVSVDAYFDLGRRIYWPAYPTENALQRPSGKSIGRRDQRPVLGYVPGR